jgi:transcriptional regulator with XRE-family HTH domain
MKPLDIRKAENLTLDEMSERLGYAKGYLSEVERGIKSGSRMLYEAYKREFGDKITYEGFFN